MKFHSEDCISLVLLFNFLEVRNTFGSFCMSLNPTGYLRASADTQSFQFLSALPSCLRDTPVIDTFNLIHSSSRLPFSSVEARLDVEALDRIFDVV